MPNRREWFTAVLAGGAALLGSRGNADKESDAPVVDEMIVIPAGKFLMGTTVEQAQRLAGEYGYDVSWFSGEMPGKQVDLGAFAIDKYPVTNRQFALFCRETGYRPRPHWHGPQPPEGLGDHPVVFVNLADAAAYARWAGKRLPTESEWEKAARGEAGLLFPWGDAFDPQACRFNADPATPGPNTAPVDAHPKGASPYGVMDMVGNVSEWCSDSPGPGAAFIKGGAWCFEHIMNLRPAARNMSGFANNPSDFYGFRCAKDVV